MNGNHVEYKMDRIIEIQNESKSEYTEDILNKFTHINSLWGRFIFADYTNMLKPKIEMGAKQFLSHPDFAEMLNKYDDEFKYAFLLKASTRFEISAEQYESVLNNSEAEKLLNKLYKGLIRLSDNTGYKNYNNLLQLFNIEYDADNYYVVYIRNSKYDVSNDIKNDFKDFKNEVIRDKLLTHYKPHDTIEYRMTYEPLKVLDEIGEEEFLEYQNRYGTQFTYSDLLTLIQNKKLCGKFQYSLFETTEQIIGGLNHLIDSQPELINNNLLMSIFYKTEIPSLAYYKLSPEELLRLYVLFSNSYHKNEISKKNYEIFHAFMVNRVNP